MGYKSENLEKIRVLSTQISEKELSEIEEKKCLLSSLEKICSMLDKSRVNKDTIKSEIRSLMEKIAN